MRDRGSYDEYVVARSTALLRTSYLLTRDWHQAEDLLQTALLKAWRVWPRIEADPDAYLHRVLVNTWCSWWRRRWRGEVATAELPEPLVDGLAAAVADRDALWRALGTLPPRQRAVVVLRYFEDLSEQQIADALGIAPGTVKSQASKALAHLRADASLEAPMGERR